MKEKKTNKRTFQFRSFNV